MDDGRPSPFEPEQLDEVLTAELDGELDAVAHDLGLDPEALSARLGATPRVAERRAALTSARELLAQAPELDELTAARLRNAALLEAELDHANLVSTRRGRRGGGGWLVAAGGIAAAVVAIGGLAVAVGGHNGSSSKASSAPVAGDSALEPTSAAAAPSPIAPGASLGAFTDAHVLAQAAVTRAVPKNAAPSSTGAAQPDGVVQSGATTTEAPAADKSSGTVQSGTSGFANESAPVSTAPPRDEALSEAQAKRASGTCAAPARVGVSGEPQARATATLKGKPVVVLVYAAGTRHTVVIEDTACAVLIVQTVA